MLIEDEQGLIQGLKQGEPGAVDQLYALYFDRLYRHIYHQVGGDHAATEDVLQETLLAALKGISRFRGDAKLSTWLYSIAGYKVADWHRRRSRRRRWLLPPSVSLDDLVVTDPAPLPEDVFRDGEMRATLRAALMQLPQHYRQALVLMYIEDFSVSEVSEIMGKSYKSVESTLVRARRALREILTNVLSGMKKDDPA